MRHSPQKAGVFTKNDTKNDTKNATRKKDLKNCTYPKVPVNFDIQVDMATQFCRRPKSTTFQHPQTLNARIMCYLRPNEWLIELGCIAKYRDRVPYLYQ